ncbi:MAG TPA: mersacidin/lichenicidin family type 2 lantibiotic [Ktedonosporobacter sp.]|nr:mersacidin/lichenicidin family type 2 lantibiotic [Ktedonosporobacter sp.]
MSTNHIIRAWRDEEYRESLDAGLSATLPESPVGAIELSESDLAAVDGGITPVLVTISLVYCVGITIAISVYTDLC